MGPGSRAFTSGCLAFLVATATVVAVGGGQDDPVDALTIGGLTGGAVALSVWLTGRREGTDADEPHP